MRKPGKGAWRRGSGCATLKLSRFGHRKNQKATVIGMAAGTLTIKALFPSRWRSWGWVVLRFFALTMDHTGHINWPANFSAHSKALLRKLARQKVQAMLQDPEYPIHPSFEAALTQQSESVATSQDLRALPAPIVEA